MTSGRSNLRHHDVHTFRHDEHLGAVAAAEGQEITIAATVTERRRTRRARHDHLSRQLLRRDPNDPAAQSRLLRAIRTQPGPRTRPTTYTYLAYSGGGEAAALEPQNAVAGGRQSRVVGGDNGGQAVGACISRRSACSESAVCSSRSPVGSSASRAPGASPARARRRHAAAHRPTASRPVRRAARQDPPAAAAPRRARAPRRFASARCASASRRSRARVNSGSR